MARRERQRDGFIHSPFKSLKGLPDSGGARRPAPPPQARPAGSETDDPDLFCREMASLDVRPLPGAGGAPGRPPAPPPPAPVDADGAGEFLAAVGRLDRIFRDELPDGADEGRARPRRMKRFARGELKPGGTLDLHGLHRDEAVQRTRSFLAHATRQGWDAVLIVTGKGLHSNEGPVLRREVERLLDAAGELVLEWGAAPRRFGGDGALVVFLRRTAPP